MDLVLIFFSLFSVLAVASALSTVISKNPVVSAMSLVLHFFTLAALYLTLNAQFVAVMQVLVYAGAIMVLVIFVIMLLNLGKEKSFVENFTMRRGIAYALAGVFSLQFLAMYFSNAKLNNTISNSSITNGEVGKIGMELFTHYLFPFEAITLLLLVAVVGALILAKKRLPE